MSILISAEELRQTLSEPARAAYRPRKFRQFLRTTNLGLEPWRQDYRIVSIEGLAQAPILASDPSGRPAPNRAPLPTVTRRDTIKTFYKFLLKAHFTDEEQIRFQRIGVNMQVERLNANNLQFEEMLERIAFNGDSTNNPVLFDDIGLSNITTGAADVLGYVGQTATLRTELPKAAGSGNQGWFDLSSGGATATALEMAKDVAYLCDTIRNATLETAEATDVVMANELWDQFTINTQGTDQTRTALDIFRTMRPGVQVRPWYKFSAAGVSNRHRIMAANMTDADAPQLVILQEPTQSAPYVGNDNLGFFINQTCIVGGVLIRKPQLVAYMDPVNQA